MKPQQTKAPRIASPEYGSEYRYPRLLRLLILQIHLMEGVFANGGSFLIRAVAQIAHRARRSVGFPFPAFAARSLRYPILAFCSCTGSLAAAASDCEDLTLVETSSLKASELNYRKTGLYCGINPPTVTNYTIYRIDTSKITFKSGTLHVYSEEFSKFVTSNYGSVDTYGVLLSEDGCELARDSDSGEGNHFRLSFDYDSSETYYIKIGLEQTPQHFGLFKLYVYVSNNDYVQLSLFDMKNASIDNPGEENLFRIDISEPGFLHVNTAGLLDTYGYLYNSDKRGNFYESDNSLLNENDDVLDLLYDSSYVPNNFNCYMKSYVSPGTYYVVIRFYSQKEAGDYYVATRFEAVDLSASRLISANGLHTDSIENTGDYTTYRIDIEQSGILTAKDTSESNYRIYLLDYSGNVLETNDDSEPESGRRIVKEVDQGRYYLIIHHQMLDGTGSHAVGVSFVSPVNYSGAIPYDLSLDYDTNHLASIEKTGGYSIYRMTVTNQSALTVYTTGSMDTFGQLLDQSGKELESNDDAIDGFYNFYISRNVDPGTYYVKVKHYSDTGTGDYEIVRSSANTLENSGSDLDGDGLTRYEEMQLFSYYRLDPLNSDSDGNGIADGYEDFDNDRVSNKYELRQFDSHPLDTYSLDPNGKIADASWLFLAPMDMNSVSKLMNAWDRIQSIDDINSSLNLVSSGQEEALDSFSSQQAATRFVGATITNGETHLNFTIDANQSNAVHDLYYIASLSIGCYWKKVGKVLAGETNAIPASLFPEKQGFFTSGSKTDTDKDGLTDGFELLVASTSPTNPDSAVDLDNDGVPDSFLELSANSYWDSKEDFDADGLPNLLEYGMGTNPLSSDSDLDGIADYEDDSNGDGTTDFEEYLNMHVFNEQIAISNGYRDITVLLNVEGTEDIDDLEYFDFVFDDNAVYFTSASITNQTYLQVRYQFLKDDVFFNYDRSWDSGIRPWDYNIYRFTNNSPSINIISDAWGQADPSHVVLPTINQAELQEKLQNFMSAASQTRIEADIHRQKVIRLFEHGLLDNGPGPVPETLRKYIYNERLHSYRVRAVWRYRHLSSVSKLSTGLGSTWAQWHPRHHEDNDFLSYYNISKLSKTFDRYANDIAAGMNSIHSGSLIDLLIAMTDSVIGHYKHNVHSNTEGLFFHIINGMLPGVLANMNASDIRWFDTKWLPGSWIDRHTIGIRVRNPETDFYTRKYMVWDSDTRTYVGIAWDPDTDTYINIDIAR